MSLKLKVLRVQETCLCFVRKWWRPSMLAGVATATWVNLVAIPLWKREVPNLTEAAAWIASCGALQWVRSWEKIKSDGE